MDADSSYYARRSREERAAARSAVDPLAQCAHLELAMRYRQLADAAHDLLSEDRLSGAAHIKARLDW